MSTDYHQDEILQKWINPDYLKPDTISRIKESSKAKPFCKYAVLDNFFNEALLDEYIEYHQQLTFKADDENLPYDSTWAAATNDGTIGSELFFHIPWHNLLAEYTDTKLVIGNGMTSVKLRAHEPDSKGFWVHTDRTNRKHVVMAALIYLNKNWKKEGSLLQLWSDITPPEPIENTDVDFRWKFYKDQRLDFLTEHQMLTTHLVTPNGIKPGKVFLLDQITPEYNRLVLTDFIRDPAYHSITPSNGRMRYAIVQWLL
jgi:hypothetical protein